MGYSTREDYAYEYDLMPRLREYVAPGGGFALCAIGLSSLFYLPVAADRRLVGVLSTTPPEHEEYVTLDRDRGGFGWYCWESTTLPYALQCELGKAFPNHNTVHGWLEEAS